jgi:polysaccharide export outer membrane protein
MRKNPSLAFVLFTLAITGSAAAAPLAQAAATPQQPKPGNPAPAGQYKPDFEIPKPEGPGGQPKAEAATPSVEGYVIGPQDNLNIIVTDEADFSGKYRVDADGTISMPYLKRVPVGGLSLQEAQDKITALLKADFLVHPQVRIEVDQFKSRSIMVMGEVRSPGKVPLPGTTLSLLEALALAGSPTQNASNEVLIMRAPKPGEKTPEPITLNRKDLELGKVGRDLALQDGDIVNIPVAKRYYIEGYVKNPGSFVLDPGTTVAQAIILAGGLSDRGSDRRISIIRTGPDGKTVEMDAKKDDKVLPNDQIKVKPRFF